MIARFRDRRETEREKRRDQNLAEATHVVLGDAIAPIIRAALNRVISKAETI